MLADGAMLRLPLFDLDIIKPPEMFEYRHKLYNCYFYPTGPYLISVVIHITVSYLSCVSINHKLSV